MDAPRWIPVALLEDLPEDGTGVTVEVEGIPVALFREGACVHALSDTCPHAGASLGAGICQDGEVTCPAHAMHFAVDDGRCTDGLPERVRAFPVQVDRSGRVLVGRGRG
jgi:anthranilate 1,2-dioxygenase ferredoxin subunit